MRFIHCADIHLGKPFGQFDEETRAALRQARLDALRAIGAFAVERSVALVLIAGDLFDAEAPPSKLVKRALDTIAVFPDVTWILLPGNHDSLAAVDLWERLERDKSDNLILATKPEVIAIGEDVAILPAPPTVKSPGYDLTDWMTGADTQDRVRIGLAHGGVADFGSEEGGLAIIPPDRAKQSDLDYLALGDWHGQKAITPHTWYAGSPETDGFKGHATAGVLLVEVAEHGSTPTIEPHPIGRYQWQRIEQVFFSGTDPEVILQDSLPQTDREFALVRFVGLGRLGLSELAALRSACERILDDFHMFDYDLTAIDVEQNSDDLNIIAESGALRVAAENLLAETSHEGRSEEEARTARAALSHLFYLAQQRSKTEIEP